MPDSEFCQRCNEDINIIEKMEHESTGTGYAKDAKHYQKLIQQPIEIMQILMKPERFIGFLQGNVMKYNLRCKGDDDKDMQKINQYSKWYDEAVAGKTINPREEE